jgi:hypothetical protein
MDIPHHLGKIFWTNMMKWDAEYEGFKKET